jgi:hypothetical protein
MLKAQDISLENNLKNNSYISAFDKCMDLKTKAKNTNDNFWWRYYYLRIAMAWDKKSDKDSSFIKAKISFQKVQEYLNEIKEMNGFNQEISEIEQKYQTYFYPLKIFLHSDKPEQAIQNAEPTGKFAFLLKIIKEEHEEYLTLLQKLRLKELKESKLSADNLQDIKFRMHKNNGYFYYELHNVPVLQADNSKLGYTVQYAYMDKQGNRKQKDTGLKTISFSSGAKIESRIAVLEGVQGDALLKIVPPANIVYLYFKDGIGNMRVNNANIINSKSYEKDGFMALEVKPDAKISLTIDNQQKKNEISSAWPVAIAAIGLISLVLAR